MADDGPSEESCTPHPNGTICDGDGTCLVPKLTLPSHNPWCTSSPSRFPATPTPSSSSGVPDRVATPADLLAEQSLARTPRAWPPASASLPLDMWCHTFLFLRKSYVCRTCAFVSRTWWAAARHPIVWSKYRAIEEPTVLFHEVTTLLRPKLHLVQRLDLFKSYGCITDSGLDVLTAQCPSLQFLDTGSSCLISDASLLALAARCCAFQSLYLRKCEGVTGRGVAALLRRCPALTVLHVSGCRNVTDDAFDALAPGRLSNVDLSETGVTDAGLAQVLPACSQLKKLWCSRLLPRHLTALLEHCRHMVELHVTNAVDLGEADLMGYIQRNPSMTALGLHCCAGVTDAFLDCVAALCPDFEYLSLYHCAHNTDHCLAAMAQCPSLKAVICSPVCGGIAAGTWRNLTRSCTNLSRLFLSSCDSVGPVGPALELPKLRSISLFSCGLTYEALHSAAARGRTVTQISLAYNKEIEDDTVVWLARLCGGLELLDLDHTNITGRAITCVAQRCAGLTELSISCCEHVDGAAFARLALCTRLTSLRCAYLPLVRDADLAAVVHALPYLQRLAFTCEASEMPRLLSRTCSALRKLELTSPLLQRYVTDALLRGVARAFPGVISLTIHNSALTLDGVRMLCGTASRLQCLEFSGRELRFTDVQLRGAVQESGRELAVVGPFL